LPRGFPQYPVAQGDDEVALLRQRNELGGRNRPQFGVVETDERFCPCQRDAVFELRLPDQRETERVGGGERTLQRLQNRHLAHELLRVLGVVPGKGQIVALCARERQRRRGDRVARAGECCSETHGT